MKKQKNTTTSGKKESKREKSKYPALNKGVNLNSRKDYIEPDYVDGVFDEDGNQIIRPLNESEKEWLNQFYEETVVTNFYHDPELRKLNRYKKAIIEDSIVKDLQTQVKELQKAEKPDKKRIRELKEIIRLTKKQNEETYAEELEYIEEELQELREDKLLYPDKEDHKQFYNDNNARNACLFNKSRITGKLIGLDTDEYDTHMAKKIQGLDVEQLPIYEIEREVYEDLEERIDNILKEVREVIKQKTKLSK